MAWVPSTPPVGSIILASDTGVYYTNLGAGPGLLFPNPLLTQVLGAFWAVTTDSQQTEQTRTIQLQGLGPNGWYNMSAPYTEGFPYPTINLTGLPFTAVRFLYTLANGCQYYSGNGTFVPPVVPPLPCTITPDFTVAAVVDANQEGLTGDGYFFIATDQYGMPNTWASNVGSVVNVVGGVYTYTVVAELQTVYAIDTQLYWRVIGGDPAPLFPPLTATQTASPSGYFLESDWINASLSDNRLVTVQGSIDGAAAVILWQGPESDLPQQLTTLGVITDLTATYLVDGCAYEVDGTTVVPDVLTVDTDCSELSYLFYRYVPQDPPTSSNSTWLFTTTSLGETLTILFIAGEFGDPLDVVSFYDGPDNTYPLLGTNSGATDLTGLTFQTTQEQMFMEVSQATDPMPDDAATWWWQMGCTSGSTRPTADVDIEEKCDEYQICISVDVLSLGDYPAINIQYAVDGGVPAIISDIDVVGPVSLGCFDYESEIVITLIVPEDPLANATLGAFTGSGACENPCLPAGASKIDGAGDLADLPVPISDGYRFLVVSDTTGIGTWQIGEVIEWNAGVWTLDTSLPGTYATDVPLQYWTTTGPGAQVTPLLPNFYLTPTGTNPNNFTLFAPDVALFNITTNEPFVLQVRTGTGPWNTVYTGTLQQVIVPLPIPVTAPFTNARVILNYLDCGLITGVVLDT